MLEVVHAQIEARHPVHEPGRRDRQQEENQCRGLGGDGRIDGPAGARRFREGVHESDGTTRAINTRFARG
ncbi:hypothetical protein ABZU76_44995 [Amycolatopsis sp. NPDC005232]|uniref:hypothetical protein n=1 Tax=Amycolatopsis sp. NPDC005232 TaxID=3157027 RepID=UPI0033B0332F